VERNYKVTNQVPNEKYKQQFRKDYCNEESEAPVPAAENPFNGSRTAKSVMDFKIKLKIAKADWEELMQTEVCLSWYKIANGGEIEYEVKDMGAILKSAAMDWKALSPIELCWRDDIK